MEVITRTAYAFMVGWLWERRSGQTCFGNKALAESQARPNPRWRILVSPINRCGRLLRAHHIPCQLSALASWKVSAEWICERGVISLLLARVVVCPVPRCNHFRGSLETTAGQVLLTPCVVRSKENLSSGGGPYTVRGQCASSRNSSVVHEP